MSDTHEHTAKHEHHGPNFKAYMMVFGALTVLTTVSFVANTMVRGEMMLPATSFVIIMGVAVVKALLVGTYFMHLIVDWGKLYYLIFPTFILAAMMIVVFLPDIVLAWGAEGKVPSMPMGGP